MSEEIAKAYEWAINQQFGSVAARYAKILANELSNLRAQLAEAKQWKDISVHQGLKIKLMEKENAELQTAYNDYIGRNNRLIEGNLELKKENAKLRELLLEVWNDWKNSPNVNDPEADGYELLQKIKKAVKHEP